MAKKVSKDLTQKQYEQLGRSVEKIVQKDYIDLAMNWHRLIRVNLLRGIAAGFGGVVGATLVVALLLWLLSLFDQIPFVNSIAETLRKNPVQ